MGHKEPHLLCKGPDLDLFIAAQGEDNMPQQGLGQAGEHVGLVVGGWPLRRSMRPSGPAVTRA